MASNEGDVAVELELIDNLTPEMLRVKAFADKTGEEVMEIKRQTLSEVRDMQHQTMRVMTGIRLLLYAFGGALDPFMQAILNIVGSTIETLVALALAEGSTIVGLPAAAVHGMIATAIQVVTLPSIIAGVEGAQEDTRRALAALDAVTLFTGVGG
jgi:hypothetical protein